MSANGLHFDRVYIDEWPNCDTSDCENKACIDSSLCFPCAAVKALRHQALRNHDFNPDACSACEEAAQILARKP